MPRPMAGMAPQKLFLSGLGQLTWPQAPDCLSFGLQSKGTRLHGRQWQTCACLPRSLQCARMPTFTWQWWVPLPSCTGVIVAAALKCNSFWGWAAGRGM